MGLRLRWVGDGTDRLSWRDLIVLTRHPKPDTSLAEQVTGGESQWGLQEHLQASLFDAVQAIIWQNSGGKGPRPKPLSRPGQDGYAQPHSPQLAEGPQGNPFNADESGVFRGEAIPIDELNEWLGWN